MARSTALHAPNAVRHDRSRLWARRVLLRVHHAGHHRHDPTADDSHYYVPRGDGRVACAAPRHHGTRATRYRRAAGALARRGSRRRVVRASRIAGGIRPASGNPLFHHRASHRRQLRQSARHARGTATPRDCRGDWRGARVVERPRPAPRARRVDCDGDLPRRVGGRSHYVSRTCQSARRVAQRIGQGNAAARAPHRGHASRVGTRQCRDARSHRRSTLERERHPRQPRHRRQHPPVGSRSASANVRAAAGDPHVLRFSFDRRRPLPHRRTLPPGAPLAARIECRVAPHPHVYQ